MDRIAYSILSILLIFFNITFWVNPEHGSLLCNNKETDSLYSDTKFVGLFHNKTAKLLTYTFYAISMNNKTHEVKVPLFSLLFTP